MVSRLSGAEIAISIAISMCRLAAPATAEEPAPSPEEARKFFEAGRQAYDAGQFTLAISLFEEAARSQPRPSVIFALGQAYRRQYLVDADAAKLGRAVEYYRKYLADAPTGDRRDEAARHIGDLEIMQARLRAEQAAPAGAPRRERTQLVVYSSTPGARAAVNGGEPEKIPLAVEVEPGTHKVLVEADGYFSREVDGVAVEGRLVPIEVPLREKPARLTVKAPAGAELEIDGQRIGQMPLAGPLELRAGAHFVALSRRGNRPFSREVSLGRGESATLATDLEPTAQRRAAWWVWGGAGVLAVAGLASTIVAWSAAADAEELEDLRDMGQTLAPDQLARHNQAVGRFDDFSTASYLLYGGAAALGVTGVILYFLDHARAAAPPLIRPDVVGGGVGATWSRLW